MVNEICTCTVAHRNNWYTDTFCSLIPRLHWKDRGARERTRLHINFYYTGSCSWTPNCSFIAILLRPWPSHNWPTHWSPTTLWQPPITLVARQWPTVHTILLHAHALYVKFSSIHVHMHVYKFMLIIVEYMNVYCMYMVYRMTSQRVNANDHMPQTNHSCI